MKILSILALVGLAVLTLVSGCCDDDPCVCPELPGEPNYFPLAIGNWWKYKSPNIDYLVIETDSIVGVFDMPFGGTAYQRVERRFIYRDGEVVVDTVYQNRSAYEVRGNKIIEWAWHAEVGVSDTLPLVILDAPLCVGKRWKMCRDTAYTYTAAPSETLHIECPANEYGQYTLVVSYNGPVTVPAGTFEDACEVYNLNGDQLGYLQAVYAAGVGRINWGGGFELTEYHLEP